jgi:uncharacterized membrane protein YhaH (DUF805 family)
MQLTARNNWGHVSLAMLKSFLLWSFVLTVCLLVMTVGALSAIILQSVLPVSSVLLVAGMIIGINILAILISAALLAAKGVHPHEVSWLHWLHGEVKTSHQAVYASCPLTCGMIH